MKSLAAVTLSRTVFWCAKLAAMAEAKIQPVPCVVVVAMRSARNSVNSQPFVDNIGGYALQMTTLDDDIFWPKLEDCPGGVLHLRKSFDFASRERPGFMQVGCDHGG